MPFMNTVFCKEDRDGRKWISSFREVLHNKAKRIPVTCSPLHELHKEQLSFCFRHKTFKIYPAISHSKYSNASLALMIPALQDDKLGVAPVNGCHHVLILVVQPANYLSRMHFFQYCHDFPLRIP